MSLFAPPRSRNRVLVSFKCGRAHQSGSRVTPDAAKGRLEIHIHPEDALMHVHWFERNASQAADDYIVLPDEAVFRRIDKVEDGRVYALDFGGHRIIFFWMQEADASKDTELVQKVNELLKTGPNLDSLASAKPSETTEQSMLTADFAAPAERTSSTSAAATATAITSTTATAVAAAAAPSLSSSSSSSAAASQKQYSQAAIDEALQQTLLEFAKSYGGAIPSGTASLVSSASVPSAKSSQAQARDRRLRERPESLADVVRLIDIRALLSSSPQAEARLLEHVPPGDTVVESFYSAQFRKCVDMMDYALQSDLAQVMAVLGLKLDFSFPVSSSMFCLFSFCCQTDRQRPMT